MKIFIKCSEAAHVCNRSQYREAGFWDKIRLRIHLLLCKLCRAYSGENIKLTKTINSANIKSLCSEEKQHLKMKLQQEIKDFPHV